MNLFKSTFINTLNRIPGNQCIIVRYNNTYRLFGESMLKRQSRMLDRFNQDIDKSMKIILKNHKVKTKVKNEVLKYTAKAMNVDGSKFVNKSLRASSQDVPSGSPEQMMVRRDGLSHAFLTTRMQILNKNFMRATSEIFYTDKEISSKVDEYKLSLTQVSLTCVAI